MRQCLLRQRRGDGARENARARHAVSAQAAIPRTAGSNTETNVHFALRVSRAMVITVVEQGQCISENNSVQIAVLQVQPFWIKIF